MSIFGAMYSGVSGLFAQSQKIAAISDNVSNANTVGYKRTQVPFSTFVTQQAVETAYSPGGVRANPRMMVSEQGLLQSTASSTDFAISGNGMFVVRNTAEASVGGPEERTYFTRAGSFEPDSDGFLRNTAGYYLQGWPLDSDGSFTNGAPARTSFNGLETINVTGLNFTGAPSTEVRYGANLPAEATQLGGIESVSAPFTALGVGDTVTIGVRNPSGGLETLVMTGTAGPPANPDEFQIGGTVTDTVANLRAALDAALPTEFSGDASAGGISVAAGGNTLFLNDSEDFSGWAVESIASTGTTGTIETARFQDLGDPITTSIEYYDNLGSPKLLDVTWEPTDVAGLWNLTVVNRGDLSGAPVAQFSIQYALSGAEAGSPQSIQGYYDMTTDTYAGAAAPAGLTFVNEDGQSLGGVPVNQRDPIIPQLQLTNGTATSPMPQTLDLNIGAMRTFDGITQFAGDYTPTIIERDGAQFSDLSRVEVDDTGVMRAIFDNGETRPIYRLPLVDFTNPEGLLAVDGNAWQLTAEAGAWYMWDAGQGPTGSIAGGSLENSTVDIAEEFSNMIVAQRSYSSNAKIIQTADEMLQEITNLKR
ncbi:MAG: flagellar hook-basal body complex protein [Alphaproteobacteria bacterium]|jgi:flagellar hook protein FlgE|nr:flagellar hook-basal body complex protein [Alphaproteobacteria bacterium]